MERGKAYLKGVTFSPDGILPSWVSCEPPIPFREVSTDNRMTTGYKEISGVLTELATTTHLTTYVPYCPSGTEQYHEQAFENMVDHGLYQSADAVPVTEIERYADRVNYRGPRDGSHWGEIEHVESRDVLMRAGQSYYPTPEDYVNEAIQVGVSKAIPVSQSREPPNVISGVTRIWIVHPNALGEDTYGIIGYAYLDDVVYTRPTWWDIRTDDDGDRVYVCTTCGMEAPERNDIEHAEECVAEASETAQIPQYIQDYQDQDRIEVVDIEEPMEIDHVGHHETITRETTDGDASEDQLDVENLEDTNDDGVPEFVSVDNRAGGQGGGRTTWYKCNACLAETTEGPHSIDHEPDCPVLTPDEVISDE